VKKRLQELIISAVEFLFLFGLWMLFVSQAQRMEAVIGAGAAVVGAVADALVKAKQLDKFRPRVEWVLLLAWEPWYVLRGSVSVFIELAKRVAGKTPDAQFQVVPFRGGGDDRESSARRALAITLTSISPDTIVVGIANDRNFMLLHQIRSSGPPLLTKRLGARA
jgi:multisubunit Na+/H+ antiporter MnhE subunit